MLDDLDPIIDDVAKAMTSVPMDANVAARLGTRIREAGARRRRAVWARPIWLVPVAAACVLTVALFLPRKATTPVTTGLAPAVDVAKAGEPVATTSPSPTPPPAPPTLPAIDVEAMDVEPIIVPAIVQAEQIDIDPIPIARIEIAPMP
jgi:hypothetical protein